MIFDSDQQRLQQTLRALPEWARAATEHPAAFWERQQAEIRKRMAAMPERSSWRPLTAWAGAFAVVLLALVLLHNRPQPRPSRAESDPDQELLIAVEQTVQSGVPQALEPAAMLAEEISHGQPISTPNRVSKENSNLNKENSNEDQ
jgi:hypothetical protein